MDVEKAGYIFGSIFITANRLQVLGDKIDPNITIKQWLFVAAIMKEEPNSPTLTEVANMIGFSRQNVKKTATVLENKGFLSLTKDTNDERAIRIELTDKCRDYFNKRNILEYNFIESLFKDFDKSEIESLFRSLNKIEKNIKNMEI